MPFNDPINDRDGIDPDEGARAFPADDEPCNCAECKRAAASEEVDDAA